MNELDLVGVGRTEGDYNIRPIIRIECAAGCICRLGAWGVDECASRTHCTGCADGIGIDSACGGEKLASGARCAGSADQIGVCRAGSADVEVVRTAGRASLADRISSGRTWRQHKRPCAAGAADMAGSVSAGATRGSAVEARRAGGARRADSV